MSIHEDTYGKYIVLYGSFFSKMAKKHLTFDSLYVTISCVGSHRPKYGEVSERFKELVLKTSDSERDRGFESHSLRNLINFELKALTWRCTQVVEGDRLESG